MNKINYYSHLGYEFYDTQIPDKISSKIVDNCNIS